MRFTEFKSWYRSLHHSQKWFVWLILLRPLIDNFYYLKHISPFLSPLYVVGVLTPFLCIWSIARVGRYHRSGVDSIIGIWLALVCFSILLVLFNNIADLDAYEILFQTLISFFIFFFTRRLVKSARDLDGILYATLVAAGIAALFFLYEILFQPFKHSITRGMQRLEGAYADVAIYGIYVTQSILISCYFLLRKQVALSRRRRTWLVTAVIAFSVFVLIKIIHASTTTISITIVLMFSLFYIRRYFIRGILFVAILFVIALEFGGDIIEKRFYPLIQADVEVYEGERDEGQIFHGRFRRWEGMWVDFSEQPMIAQLFGMPLSVSQPYKYITAGTHNDFLRIMFLSGMIGLVLYFIFLFNIFMRIRWMNAPHKFLVLGTLATLLLYSVSTAPNLYAPLIYVVYPVFAFSLLPEKVLRQSA